MVIPTRWHHAARRASGIAWRDLSRGKSWGPPGAGRGLACAEFALAQNSNNLKKSPVDLQPLTTIQQNNSIPQPPHSRAPITLTVCVTTHPSTTSRQHCFHRTAPLYMERRIFFRSPVRKEVNRRSVPADASVRRSEVIDACFAGLLHLSFYKNS